MSNPALATRLVIPFEELRNTDVDIVGGKNASLGEMISQLAATGVRVPGGFATTSTSVILSSSNGTTSREASAGLDMKKLLDDEKPGSGRPRARWARGTRHARRPRVVRVVGRGGPWKRDVRKDLWCS